MVDNPTSRGIKRDFTFDNLRLTERLVPPSIDTNNATSTRPILPAGNLGTTVQSLPLVTPVKKLVYSDGKNWVPLAPQTTPTSLVTEVGYIGLGFNSSQIIPPSTPTIVALNNNFGASFPSFTEDLVGPNFGFMINIDGIYIK